MRLSIKALALAVGLLWGGAILLVGLVNLAAPAFGSNFLQMVSSVYPGFHASRALGSVLVGTVDGFVDGAIAGLLLGWLYNCFAVRRREA